jgi:NhaP-type Na+/H+ or K+/H+ antiporter
MKWDIPIVAGALLALPEYAVPLVITVQQAHLAGVDTILRATYLTIGLSVFAHGITAAPLARRYARWYETHPRHRKPPMESVHAPDHRVRWRPRPPGEPGPSIPT